MWTTIVNFILGGWKFIIKNWKIVLIIVTILLGLWVWKLRSDMKFQKAEAARWESNYVKRNDTLSHFRDELGRTVSKMKTLYLDQDELEGAIHSKDSLIRKFGIELESQNIKYDRLHKAYLLQLQSSGEGTAKKSDTIFIYESDTAYGTFVQVNDGYLDIALFDDYNTDSVEYEYTYTEEIFGAVYVTPKLNKKGKQRFWHWLIPKWEGEGTVKSLNPDSKITSAFEIEVVNRKKKRGE